MTLFGVEGDLVQRDMCGHPLYKNSKVESHVQPMPEPQEVMDKRLGLEHPVWPVDEVASPEQPVRWLQPSILKHDWKADN